MGSVYCEFCGQEARNRIDNPVRFVAALHSIYKDVVRCAKHRKTSKTHSTCRTHDPLTGIKK